jgi:hypothetical protein
LDFEAAKCQGNREAYVGIHTITIVLYCGPSTGSLYTLIPTFAFKGCPLYLGEIKILYSFSKNAAWTRKRKSKGH